MKVFTRPGDFATRGRKVSLAIGMFDGVHLGHQQVIRQAVSDAEQHEGTPIAITFDRHPSATLAPERVPLLIHSQPQKLRALESLGIKATLIIPFTREFSLQPAKSFITSLTEALAPVSSICVGSSFVFGHGRSGDVALLKQMGKQLDFAVHGIAAVSLDGEIVSSTRIREAVRRGDLNAASQMLGREYSLQGAVMRGDGIARKLGYATANLAVAGLVVPPAGVYAVHAYLDGQPHRAVVNVGFRPTLQKPTPELRVEAHLLGFEGDLYGREMELTFVEKLREERKFESLDALKTQIQKDIEAARSSFQ